jgi:hypothetical protein
MRFENDPLKKLPELNRKVIGPGDFSGNNLQYLPKKGMQPVS